MLSRLLPARDSVEEAHLRKSVTDYICALNEKDIQKLIDWTSDDIIIVLPDISPLLGKKVNLDRFIHSFKIYDRDFRVVSIRINMSKTGDLAQCWVILDHFLDDVQVARALSFNGWRVEDGVWRLFSLSQHEVDLNWT